MSPLSSATKYPKLRELGGACRTSRQTGIMRETAFVAGTWHLRAERRKKPRSGS